jgi:hypothetical protein
MRGRIIPARALALPAAGLLLLAAAGHALAGTRGKISGRVADDRGNPVDVATIVVLGAELGSYSDDEGRYTVLNVPPGTYEVRVHRQGFESIRVQDVSVSADQTTWLNFELGEAPLTAPEVVVTAERPVLDLDLTSSQTTLTLEEIETLPIQELNDVVNLQAGVVDGHFRGGRSGEVQYQVDGVSVNNPYDNSSSLSLDRSVLQEVQVISGTFDAEYGQAMSGVVNAVLKEGTEQYEWGAEAYGGSFVFAGSEQRLANDEIRLDGIRSYQAFLSGPLPLPSTVFIASARRYHFDDYLTGTRDFVPTDSSDFENKVFVGSGDGAEVPLGTSREWSGLLKVTNASIPSVKVGYELLFEDLTSQWANYAYRLNPDGRPEQNVRSITHGLSWSQLIGDHTVVQANVRHLDYEYTDWVYEDVFDPRYDAAGPPRGDSEYELGAFVQGVDFGRFRQTTRGLLAKGSVTRQVTAAHELKTGGEAFWPILGFGVPGHLSYTTVDGVEQLVRHVDEPPDFPGMREYRPNIGAAFVQDRAEWPDLTVRAGLRLDYFDPRASLPGDAANPANAIEGAPVSPLVSATKKVYLSPRLGVAYPVRDRGALHFAYGHFRQFPAIGTVYANADYSVLRNLQSGGVSYGVLGNPDVEPEKTVQYEMGYKHAISEDLGVDVTAFYKDIRDLLGVEFVPTYNGAEYARLTNVDFGNVFGVTVSIDHRRIGPAAVSLDYTWQRAEGNASDPRETATRAEAGEDPRPRLVPLTWDQRHTLNVTVSISEPGLYNASAVLRLASGQPYTPVLESGFGRGLDTNSGRKPTGAVIDLRTERVVGRWWETSVSVFARAFNVLDTRFFNGFVFPSTGSVDYSRFPETDRVALANPTRFYAPRRIEVGVRLGSGAP